MSETPESDLPQRRSSDRVDVSIAARLAEAAKPGEIIVSDRALEKLAPGARATGLGSTR